MISLQKTSREACEPPDKMSWPCWLNPPNFWFPTPTYPTGPLISASEAEDVSHVSHTHCVPLCPAARTARAVRRFRDNADPVCVDTSVCSIGGGQPSLTVRSWSLMKLMRHQDTDAGPLLRCRDSRLDRKCSYLDSLPRRLSDLRVDVIWLVRPRRITGFDPKVDSWDSMCLFIF